MWCGVGVRFCIGHAQVLDGLCRLSYMWCGVGVRFCIGQYKTLLLHHTTCRTTYTNHPALEHGQYKTLLLHHTTCRTPTQTIQHLSMANTKPYSYTTRHVGHLHKPSST